MKEQKIYTKQSLLLTNCHSHFSYTSHQLLLCLKPGCETIVLRDEMLSSLFGAKKTAWSSYFSARLLSCRHSRNTLHLETIRVRNTPNTSFHENMNQVVLKAIHHQVWKRFCWLIKIILCIINIILGRGFLASISPDGWHPWYAEELGRVILKEWKKLNSRKKETTVNV